MKVAETNKNRLGMTVGLHWFMSLLVASALFLCVPSARGESPEATPVRVSHFTGKPVPRFEQLRATKVNGRFGPSRAHPIRWQYARKGLPVLVVKESIDWRMVRDPEGDEVWIHASLLSRGSTIMVRRTTMLFADPDKTAGVRAQLERGVIGDLQTCEDDWCRVRIGSRKGWVERSAVWGDELYEAVD